MKTSVQNVIAAIQSRSVKQVVTEIWHIATNLFVHAIRFKSFRWERVQRDYRHKTVAAKITNGTPVLDVGGQSFSNLGMYIPNEVVTVNKSRLCHPTILGDAHHLPIRPKSFDTVVAIQILQQIPTDKKEQLINELRNVAQKKIVLHAYQKDFWYKDGRHQSNPFKNSSCPYEDLKKIMLDARWTKLNFPYMLIVETAKK